MGERAKYGEQNTEKNQCWEHDWRLRMDLSMLFLLGSSKLRNGNKYDAQQRRTGTMLSI